MSTLYGNGSKKYQHILKIPPPSEHRIMNDIIDLLRYDNWFVERNNVGATKIPQVDKYGNASSRFVRFNTVGKADITALKNGVFVAIEVKTPKTYKNVTIYQSNYLEMVNSHGGIGFVAWSVEMVAKKLGIPMLFP